MCTASVAIPHCTQICQGETCARARRVGQLCCCLTQSRQQQQGRAVGGTWDEAARVGGIRIKRPESVVCLQHGARLQDKEKTTGFEHMALQLTAKPRTAAVAEGPQLATEQCA